MNGSVDVLAVLDRLIGNARTVAGLTDDHRARDNLREGEQARAAVAELIEGPYSQRARLGHLLDSLRFDEQLNGGNPKRSTLDFPHAIQIVEAAIAALARVGGAV